MRGPVVVEASRPSPTLSLLTRSVTISENLLYTLSCTNTRLAQMHVCPALRSAESTTPLAASSRSASSNTMKGALPPSSRLTRLTVCAAPAISILPTAVLPVNPILRTLSLFTSSWPMDAASPITRFSTPSGAPALSSSSARATAVRGVSSEGLRTTVQPAASAGATLRVIIDMGKFQGVMAATTPTACFIVTMRRSRATVSSTSPHTRRPSSANHSAEAAPEMISALASARGLPHSMVMMVAMSSAWRRISSCHLRRTAPRSLAVIFLQGSNME
mmetsp:Transcript_1192/g.2569  ORF Transcript_1192/g.2569 Transcript_1192/m.2569 type:complete len:275 (-) Transcript_1192:326-1150(-)